MSSKKRTSKKKTSKIKSNLFKKISKNKICNGLDLIECINPNIKILGEPTIIGSGTYGVVLRYKTEHDDIAIKYIFNIIDINFENTDPIISNINKEIAYTKYMSDNNIGPKIYDTMYYSIKYDDFFPNGYSEYNYQNTGIFSKILKIKNYINEIVYSKDIYKHLRSIYYLINNYNKKTYKKTYSHFNPIEDYNKHNYDTSNLVIHIHCVVMKAYDMDADSALYNSKIYPEQKNEIVKQMVHLLYKQIYNTHLYCSDIKPSNYVVNINNYDIDVKMIDFGENFCSPYYIFKKITNQEIKHIYGVNSKQLLYISNIIQLYIEIYKPLFKKSNYTSYHKKELIDILFGSNIFSKFFKDKDNWKIFIDKYIDLSKITVPTKVDDASTNLLWYASKKINSNKKNCDNIDNENIKKIKKYLTEKLKIAYDIYNNL